MLNKSQQNNGDSGAGISSSSKDVTQITAAGEPEPEPSQVIRVLLADDHALVREGTRRLLETESDVEVVAEAASGEEAIAAAHCYAGYRWYRSYTGHQSVLSRNRRTGVVGLR
jgi:hypothetical protein